MSTQSSHTGFRNQKLFCFNCGGSQPLELPMRLLEVSAIMKKFDNQHKDCKPNWKEPVPNPILGNNSEATARNLEWWLTHGEQGISSNAIVHAVLGRNVHSNRLPDEAPPADPDDFSRCYKLLQAVPQIKDRFSKICTLGDVWTRVYNNWDKLTMMYEQNVREKWQNAKQIGMYEFMKSLGC